ncbi:DUF1800 domain-containing protein [Chitinophaga nivalis]|uniref:DUF1800 domain-containing protein n=1 Tax=Chitinophaga nivalis TaxID=2991709 RepID=A0ABT3ITW0_9BACT|nr:DUF1800 domain-containing protein [Chitinophaga nivalis]MCW3463176.1 DUF1800 domain-containing protein [Chitinophaga nivalis]MCW3487134.1 DUF1800 domain-containing protein [Chitinophaga nivalis]
MDRRQFLTLSPDRRARTSTAFARTDTGIAPYTGSWGTLQLIHLLKRTLFGVSPANIHTFRNLSMQQAVDLLLTPQAAPTPPVNNYGVDDTGVAPGATWVKAPRGDAMLERKRISSYKAWWIGQMINQPASIHEKMVLFWHNHFVTETAMIHDSRYSYQYNLTLRQYALGNFKDLTKAVTLDPGMLVYLNGDRNSKEAADENYARELHELFTVGKGPDSHYTEEDVRATARVLTGFRINDSTITSYFDSTKHDITNKAFSGFYANKVISGKTGAEGASELDDLLGIIFLQPEAAKFICRKLYRFFVYYDIDAATEKNVIVPLATIFRESGYDIHTMLNALFTSEHFYDQLNMACLIKSPADFCVGLCREYSVRFPTDETARYKAWNFLQARAAAMLQNLGDPPLVAGWDAYYQEPAFHELWINTDTLPKRNQLSDGLISSAGTNGLQIDPIFFAEQLSDPANPVTLVNDSLDILYRVGVSDNLKAFLKNTILLSGQSPNSDYYWTSAWKAYKAAPGDAAKKQDIYIRLQALYKYIMDLSEYQLS